MLDDELQRFKRDIHLVEYATGRHGYVRDKRESSRASHVLRRAADDDKIIVARLSDGHWTYFSVRDGRDHGTIIDFLRRRGTPNLGRIREELRHWLGTPRPPRDPAIAFVHRPAGRDRQRVAEAFGRARSAQECPYLHARGIRPETLQERRFAGTWKLDAQGNVLFAHRDDKGITGFEIKNRDLTRFSAGGTKALWQSLEQPTDRRLVIAESAIDALSYHQLHAKDAGGALYLSTSGTPGREQLRLLDLALARLPAGREVVSAVDADEAGGRIAAQIESLAHAHPAVSLRRHSPAFGKDWNDVLQRVERDMIRSLPREVQALGPARGRDR